MNKKVMQIIDSEVDYASGKWDALSRNERPLKDADKPVEFWLMFIRAYLRKAEDACYGTDKTQAMENVRKIAALCVRCITHHKTPERKD